MCSDVGSWRTTVMLSYTYSKDWWTSNKLPLTHLFTTITLLIKLSACSLYLCGEQAAGWIGMSSGVTIPIICSFCIFFGGKKNWPAVKKTFDHFYVHWVFSFLSSKKRLLVLIIVVAWVWYNTSEVTPSERQGETSTQHSPDLFLPLLSSFITKGIWLIVVRLRYQKKTKIKITS